MGQEFDWAILLYYSRNKTLIVVLIMYIGSCRLTWQIANSLLSSRSREFTLRWSGVVHWDVSISGFVLEELDSVPVPLWHHLLFGIRFYCFVLFIKYWFLESRYKSVLVLTYHLLFPFIVFSWYIVVFIDNSRARTCEYAHSVRYVNQQRRRNPFPPLKISISIVVYKDFEG